jgi:hypothetical protein
MIISAVGILLCILVIAQCGKDLLGFDGFKLGLTNTGDSLVAAPLGICSMGCYVVWDIFPLKTILI